MTTRRTAALFLVSATMTGCATQVLDSSDYKGYSVGQTLTAPVGGTFLVNHGGSISRVRRWVGLFNSPTGWAESTVHSRDYFRKELVYSGISGTVIEIAYREYRGQLAAPAFYQNVKYDLATSNTITFQNFQISVNNATNERFEGTLLRD